jgi:polyisoprenoid-binding protein YceI
MTRLSIRSVLPALPCLLALSFAARAESADYRLDDVHTRIVFAVSHAGYSQALGTVSGSTGTLHFDPDDWSTARVSVSIPMKRLDLGNAGWNRAAGGEGLLDIAGHPVATFVSNRIVPKDPRHAQVCGPLTLRGVARDTCLDVTFNQLKRLSVPPFRRIAGFSATGSIDRQAFGVASWAGVIGDKVDLRIEAEAEPTRTDTRDAPPAAPSAPAAAPAPTPTTDPDAPRP